MNLSKYLPTTIVREAVLAFARKFAHESLSAYFESILAAHGEVTPELVLAKLNEDIDVPVLSEAQEAWAFRTFFGAIVNELILWWALNRDDEGDNKVVIQFDGQPATESEAGVAVPVPDASRLIGVYRAADVELAPADATPEPNAATNVAGDGRGEGASDPE